ncbi:MAG: cell division protein FtsQ/DivIB [Hungatella sp.]
MAKLPKKKSHRILGIIVAVMVLFGILVTSVHVTDVTVTGNSRYTDEQIIQMILQKEWDWNSLYCYAKDRLKAHRSIPFVEDYKIVFQGLSKIEIIVYEKSIVGYVSYMGSYMYFDKDGIIVESTNEKLEDIPWLTGLSFGHIVLHQQLPVENQKIFDEILNLTQVLSVHRLFVDKIQYDARGEATLHMGELEVVLGDSSNVSGKISELSAMLPQLEGLSGTLHLETYDETNAAMTYTFKKKLQNY